jgi:uncharacterized protein (TIGR00251 family)
MLKTTEKAGGVEFEVLARPKAAGNEVAGVHDGALRVAVTAPPEKGKANAAILRLLAEILDVSLSSIRIVAGETSRRKRVYAEGISEGELLIRVESALRRGEK